MTIEEALRGEVADVKGKYVKDVNALTDMVDRLRAERDGLVTELDRVVGELAAAKKELDTLHDVVQVMVAEIERRDATIARLSAPSTDQADA